MLRLMSESVLPVSSRSFKASGLRFKSLISFECISVDGVKEESSMIHGHIAVQFSSTIY